MSEKICDKCMDRVIKMAEELLISVEEQTDLVDIVWSAALNGLIHKIKNDK